MVKQQNKTRHYEGHIFDVYKKISQARARINEPDCSKQEADKLAEWIEYLEHRAKKLEFSWARI